MTSSSDVRPCTDVMVASEAHAQLQQQLLREVASRKAAEHRANCLHQLLTELRNRKVSFTSQTPQSAHCHMFCSIIILNRTILRAVCSANSNKHILRIVSRDKCMKMYSWHDDVCVLMVMKHDSIAREAIAVVTQHFST